MARSTLPGCWVRPSWSWSSPAWPGGLLLASVPGGVSGSSSISDVLIKIADHVTVVRISTAADLATSVGEIALAALLYTALRSRGRVLAPGGPRLLTRRGAVACHQQGRRRDPDTP